MRETHFDAVPAERRDIARTAWLTTFGSLPFTPLKAVSGGASGSLIYRANDETGPRLLRLESARNVLQNPHRGHACMRAASDAGIAPRLHHADPVAGVAIMDFVPQQPLQSYPGGHAGLAHALGKLVARLQATPVFPPLAEYPHVLSRSLDMLRTSGLFAAGLLDPHIEGFERIREAYPWDGSLPVSSHNDPNPTNILFDGKRLWLVDWEISFRNDPLADVAILANNFAATPELEDALLQSWLGRAPNRVLRAKLRLMRQMTQLFYACLALSGSIGRHATETDLAAPTPAEFRDAVEQGRLIIGQAGTVHLLGKTCLADFLAGFSAPGFDEVLAVARQA